MFTLRIAWRFLRSSPVQSALIAAGIAVGIATQIFVGSIIVSLQASLLETTIGSASQVTIQAIKESDPVRYTKEMQHVLSTDPRVKPGSIAPIRSVPALYSNGTDSSSIGLIGGRLKDIDGVYRLRERTVSGRASLGTGEIMLGKEFAEKYRIRAGDTISLKFQNNEAASFTVSGIFDLGSAQFNQRNSFVAGEVPQNVLGWGNNQYSQIQTQLKQPYDSVAVAHSWSQQLPGVSVVEWQGQNKDLLAGLRSQSASSYMIQAFVPRGELSAYGVIGGEPEGDSGRLYRISDLVEKPKAEDAPSDLAIIGRYILTPDIFDELERTPRGAGGEIQLTDGLRELGRRRPLFGYRFEGVRHDAGNKLGFLKATVEFALKREDLGGPFREYLKSLRL